MAEYIERERLRESLKAHYHPTDKEYESDRQWAVGYNAGLDRALHSLHYAPAADVAPVPCWISVKEKVPEKWQTESEDLINYMVFMPEYGVDIGNYLKPAKAWVCMGIPCKVTHWMPLPEPPKED